MSYGWENRESLYPLGTGFRGKRDINMSYVDRKKKSGVALCVVYGRNSVFAGWMNEWMSESWGQKMFLVLESTDGLAFSVKLVLSFCLWCVRYPVASLLCSLACQPSTAYWEPLERKSVHWCLSLPEPSTEQAPKTSFLNSFCSEPRFLGWLTSNSGTSCMF